MLKSKIFLESTVLKSKNYCTRTNWFYPNIFPCTFPKRLQKKFLWSPKLSPLMIVGSKLFFFYRNMNYILSSDYNNQIIAWDYMKSAAFLIIIHVIIWTVVFRFKQNFTLPKWKNMLNNVYSKEDFWFKEDFCCSQRLP